MARSPPPFPQTPPILLQSFLHEGKQRAVDQSRHGDPDMLRGRLLIDRVRVLGYLGLAPPRTQPRSPLAEATLAENRLAFVGGVAQHTRDRPGVPASVTAPGAHFLLLQPP